MPAKQKNGKKPQKQRGGNNVPLHRSTPLFQRRRSRDEGDENDGPDGSSVKKSADRRKDRNNNESPSPSLEYRRSTRSPDREKASDRPGSSRSNSQRQERSPHQRTPDSGSPSPDRSRNSRTPAQGRSHNTETPRRSQSGSPSSSPSNRSRSRSPLRDQSSRNNSQSQAVKKNPAPKGSAKGSAKKKKQTIKHIKSGATFSLTKRLVAELRFYQNTTKLLVPRKSFSRIVREIMAKYDPTFRIQSEALEALQEASEAFLVHYMSDSNLCTHHAKRVTLFRTDMHLVKELKYTHLFVGIDK